MTWAFTGDESMCWNQRTKDVSRPPESQREMRTPTQKLADLYLADFERRAAEDRAEEQRKAEEWRQRRKREQQEADRRRKEQELKERRARYEFIESQQDFIFDEMGLNSNERAVVRQRLDNANADNDLEKTKVFALQVAAERLK
jgi:hypothetical protein